MLTLLLLAGLASAGGSDCVDCCKQAGLVGCPTQIRAHGPDSHLSKEGGAWRVSGLWLLDCDTGATYQDGATAVVAQRPMAGQVIRMATPTSALNCFAQHCALPAGSCMRAAGNTGEVVLVRCSDNGMLTESEMTTSAPPPEPAPAPAPPQPAAPAPTALDLTLPPPATRCADTAGLMDAAQAQASQGDTRLSQGARAEAANTYRAALTIDPCNAGGWTGLGHVALLAGDHRTAVTALEAATGLKPKVTKGWFLLGKAHVATGEKDDARDAFDRALELSPDHAEAISERAALDTTE